jgi:DNA polymerase-3 subunit delta'
VAIIDDADVLSEEAANALLKTLEEPPPGSVLILIGTSPERQLPTIRSRCQIIRLRPPETGDAALLIARELGVTDTQLAARLARQSAGSIELAGLLLNHELGSFREFLLPALARLPAGSVALATRIVAFVEEAGKEAIERRVRLRLVIELAVEFYRDMTRRLSGTQPPADEENDPLIAQATASALAEAAHWNDEQAAECVDRCMQALSHVDRNANLATLTECWIDDLARLAAGEVPVRLTA